MLKIILIGQSAAKPVMERSTTIPRKGSRNYLNQIISKKCDFVYFIGVNWVYLL